MTSIIAVFIFLSVFLLIVSIHILLSNQTNIIANRLKNVENQIAQIYTEEALEKRKIFDIKDALSKIGKFIAARSYINKVQDELSKADLPMSGEEYIGLIMSLLTGGFLLGFFVFGGLGPAMILAILGYLMPLVFIKQKKNKRFAKINAQIGDCITIMSNALKAGYSFHQTIDLVGKEMTGPLAMEFRKTLREINLGKTSDNALQNLADRVESKDMDLLVTAVLIQRQTGGNLAEILDNISHTIRERIRIKGEIKSLTAQGRISGLIIGLLPPILFAVLMLINPAYMYILVTHPTGRTLLIVAVVSELLGLLLIKKIVDIDV